MRRGFLFVIAFLFAQVAASGDVSRVDVIYKDREYRVEVEAMFDASADVVFDILTDYKSWPSLSDIIVESHIEEILDPFRLRVSTVSRGCVLAFCKTVRQVQWMETSADWTITATIMPEHSDLRSGWARTRLEAVGDSTRFRYEMTIVPDFWVPPFIGPAVIRYKLRQEALETARVVEIRARQAR